VGLQVDVRNGLCGTWGGAGSDDGQPEGLAKALSNLSHL